MRIAVSPAFREKHDLTSLEREAERLDVRVSTEWRNRLHAGRALWRVRVRQGERVVQLDGEGALAAVIAGALLDFEEAYP